LTIKLTQHVAVFVCPSPRKRTRDARTKRVRISSPFHSRYSSRTCGLHRQNRRRFFRRNCLLPSVVKEPSLHSRWSVSQNGQKRKTRRQAPGHSVHSLRDGFARSSTSFYPVFVTNLTSDGPKQRGNQRLPTPYFGQSPSREYSIFEISVKPCCLCVV